MAEILLTLALTLLIEAQKPHVPEAFKTQAVELANRAILEAMNEIPAESTSYSEPAKKEEREATRLPTDFNSTSAPRFDGYY